MQRAECSFEKNGSPTLKKNDSSDLPLGIKRGNGEKQTKNKFFLSELLVFNPFKSGIGI